MEEKILRHESRSRRARHARLRATIEPTWHVVREIREEVSEVLMDYAKELRQAAVLTSSELVENAIKYGERVAEAPSMQFSLEDENGELRIQMINGSKNPMAVRELLLRIDELRRSPDKALPYLTRLQYLLEYPSENSKLGLYRIAFEGGFNLSCQYQGQVVTITATREAGTAVRGAGD